MIGPHSLSKALLGDEAKEQEVRPFERVTISYIKGG